MKKKIKHYENFGTDFDMNKSIMSLENVILIIYKFIKLKLTNILLFRLYNLQVQAKIRNINELF